MTKVIQDEDRMAPIKKKFCDSAADITSTAGDEKFHGSLASVCRPILGSPLFSPKAKVCFRGEQLFASKLEIAPVADGFGGFSLPPAPLFGRRRHFLRAELVSLRKVGQVISEVHVGMPCHHFRGTVFALVLRYRLRTPWYFRTRGTRQPKQKDDAFGTVKKQFLVRARRAQLGCSSGVRIVAASSERADRI